MGPMAIAERLKDSFPEEVLEIIESRGQVGVVVRRERIKALCHWLRHEPDLDFNLLMDLCGVDYTGMNKDYFEVVYNLYSISQRHMIRLRARVPAEDCRIDSVTSIWQGTNWHERECYDLLGIVFEGHPDLRRILLPDDWVGHPLRKDYPLQISGKQEWAGYEELKELSKRLQQFSFQEQGKQSEKGTTTQEEHRLRTSKHDRP